MLKKTRRTSTSILLTEPSPRSVKAYFQKARYYLGSAKLLLLHEHLEQTVCMIYYSMYFSTMALFAASGLQPKRHTTAIILLKDLFGIDNSPLIKARDERLEKQYVLDAFFSRKDIRNLLYDARRFHRELSDFCDTITDKDAMHYRRMAIRMGAARIGL